jgi:hypothetical protein
MKYILHQTYKIVLVVSFISTLVFAQGSIKSNQYVNNKVEVGIESIIKDGEDYIISIYAINPYDPIAGVQFKFFPEDLFIIKEVYGGRCEEKGFQIHHNKSGTILGFSMVANTLDPSTIVSGPSKLNENIVLNIKASPNKIQEYNSIENDIDIMLECVFASKKGLVLESNYVPFKISQIK